MHLHMPLIASGKVKFTYVQKESRRQTLVPSSTFEPRNSKIDPSCENPSAPHELRSRVIMGQEGDHGRHSPTGRMPVLRKNLRQTERARVSVQWRQVSCVPTQKRLVEGLRLCEAELPCFGFNSHGGIASAPSLSSSGNCCRMDCSS